MPHPRRQWLSGIGLARPREHLRQQTGYESLLVLGFGRAITQQVGVVGFVPQVPGEYALVVRECTDDAFHIVFKPRILLPVPQSARPRALHPSGIVDSGSR